MQQKVLAWVGLLFICFGLHAQKNVTISGTIKDGSTGESLIGATVSVEELPNTGTTTNEYGFYSLSIPPGMYIFSVSYVGFADQKERVNLSVNISKDWN
ncbi:MAG TPA: carboxypeptidase-like regulatory domain-containing protein, partial [Saprospiraceae bacterium]|nr:carboxypeptidase-like regulatory domain-containing protein [Saprospiraceae bacterium]